MFSREVEALLDAYERDILRDKHTESFRNFLESSKNAGDLIATPEHLTVSAWISSCDSQKVLLHYHQKIGDWIQPGGHVENFDGSLEQAIRREVLEETGLNIQINGKKPVLNFNVYVASHTQKCHSHYDICFLVYANQEESLLEGNQWVSLDQLSQVTSDTLLLKLSDRFLSQRS